MFRQLGTAWTDNRAILPWVFERLFAFLAYIAMAGSVVYGLLLSTKILDVIAHRPITFALHQDLASIGLGLAGIHGMLLGLDKTVPFSLAQIAVPGLAPYAPLAVAAGQVGFYLMAVVVGSFYLRRRHRPADLAHAPLPDVPRLRRGDGPRDRGRNRQRDAGRLVALRRLDDGGRLPPDVPDRPVGRRQGRARAVGRHRATSVTSHAGPGPAAARPPSGSASSEATAAD